MHLPYSVHSHPRPGETRAALQLLLDPSLQQVLGPYARSYQTKTYVYELVTLKYAHLFHNMSKIAKLQE